jgi:hypothetical protein
MRAYQRGAGLPYTLFDCSMRVAWNTLAILAANRYLARPTSFKLHHVTFRGIGPRTRG